MPRATRTSASGFYSSCKIGRYHPVVRENYRVPHQRGVNPGWLLKSDFDARFPAGRAAFFNSTRWIERPVESEMRSDTCQEMTYDQSSLTRLLPNHGVRLASTQHGHPWCRRSNLSDGHRL